MSRPKVLQGKTVKIGTGCGSLYVTCNFLNNKIQEVFVRLGKSGGCSSCQTEALGRLISLALKNNVSPEKIIKTLKGISCHRPTIFGKYKILSCADATAKAMEIALKGEPTKNLQEKNLQQSKEINKPDKSAADNIKKIEEKNILQNKSKVCPECGSPNLRFEGGCFVCQDCNYSECG